jgi:hypothetical protein
MVRTLKGTRPKSASLSAIKTLSPGAKLGNFEIVEPPLAG